MAFAFVKKIFHSGGKAARTARKLAKSEEAQNAAQSAFNYMNNQGGSGSSLPSFNFNPQQGSPVQMPTATPTAFDNYSGPVHQNNPLVIGGVAVGGILAGVVIGKMFK